MKALIDADVLTYAIPFSLQQGAELQPDAMRVMCARLDSAIENILTDSECDDYDLYLTGDGNFRNSVATLRPYKGGRPPRPLLYEAARAYLLREHPAFLTEGIEADDLIGIHATQYGLDSVMCSIDKDLDNIPGNRYRWPIIRDGKTVTPGKKYCISPEEATYNFYVQMLTGDTVDNIQGVPRVGIKKAEALLSMLMPENAMMEAVYNEYARYYTESTKDPYAIFVENGMLLWICTDYVSEGVPATFEFAKSHLLAELIDNISSY